MTVTPTGFPLRGRIRLTQLLNNVTINRNTKFERRELLPIKTVFQIQIKNPLLPRKMAIAQNICMAVVRTDPLSFREFRASIVFLIMT